MSIFRPSQVVEKIDTPPARLWLVFFSSPRGVAWWCRILRPGFRHVYAASWYADADRWVVFNPTRRGTVIELWSAADFPRRLDQFLAESSAVLRVASRHEREHPPPMPWCVGQVKALLGIRSAALTPWQLYHALRARGAEPVVDPCVAANPDAAAPSRS